MLVDFDRPFVVRAAESESTQGYTPFAGLQSSANVVSTYLRGAAIYDAGKIIGPPRGRYLSRPY